MPHFHQVHLVPFFNPLRPLHIPTAKPRRACNVYGGVLQGLDHAFQVDIRTTRRANQCPVRPASREVSSETGVAEGVLAGQRERLTQRLEADRTLEDVLADGIA